MSMNQDHTQQRTDLSVLRLTLRQRTNSVRPLLQVACLDRKVERQSAAGVQGRF